MTGPAGATLSTKAAVEDTIVILRRTIDRASRTIALGEASTMRRSPLAA